MTFPGSVSKIAKGSRRFLIIAVIVAVVLASAGVWTTYRPSFEETVIPIPSTVIQDDLGRNVTLSKYPEKIVSLAPVNTEILFALGLEDKVVGVTMYCDYPPEVKDMVADGRITIIGGFSDPSIEKVVALKPDLVLAVGGIQVPIVEQLGELGLTVVALEPKNLDDVLKDILLVGETTGKFETANHLAERMKQRINRITSMVEDVDYRPRVYYEIWHDPLMSVGSGTWIDDLIKLAGGKNIFSDAKIKYPEINSESVIARNPEIIVIKVGYMGGVAKEEIKKRPGWEVIDAVKNDRIYEVEENILIRPGPRIVEGLETLAKITHPELFEQS